MTHDPFRALDPVGPPDQWADIAARAAADDALVDVDLDPAGPSGPGGRRWATVGVAAAVLAVAAAAAGVVAVGGDDTERVAGPAATEPDPTPPPAAAPLGGACPFTFSDPSLPAPVEVAEEPVADALPGAVATVARTAVDGLEVTVRLEGVTDLGSPLFGPIGTRDVTVVDDAGGAPAGQARVIATLVVSDEPPCTDLTASATGPAGDTAATQAAVERVLDAVVPPSGPVPPDLGSDLVHTAEPFPARWSGVLSDGRTYEVVVDEDRTRLLVDGVEARSVDGPPTWVVDADGEVVDNRSFGFTLNPQPDGQDEDEILVGAVPPDTVETFVVDADGDEVTAPSLALSPGGAYYSLDLRDVPDTGPNVWFLRHRLADGTVVRGVG